MNKYCCCQMTANIDYGYVEYRKPYFFINVPHPHHEGFGSLGMMYCPWCGSDIYPRKQKSTGETVYTWQTERINHGSKSD